MNDHWILIIHDFGTGDIIGIIEGNQEHLFKVQDKLFKMDELAKKKRDAWLSNESLDSMETETELYGHYIEEHEKIMNYICNCGLPYTPFSELLKVGLS